MARYARFLIDKGILKPPYYFNVLLGNVATAGCDPADLAAIMKELPDDAIWCVAGIGRAQLVANTLGILFGHGVRVGLEDNIFYEGKELATNAQLVERVVRIAGELGYEPMTPAETRAAIGLGAPAPAPESVS